MSTPLAFLLLALAATPPSPSAEDARLAASAAAILRADYRGERAELARLAEAVEAPGERGRPAVRAYWAAFAWWRRGMNGTSLKPPPADLEQDFCRCEARARAALALEPGLDDAAAALVGCLMGQAFVRPRAPGQPRPALAGEALAQLHALEPRAAGNPRLLWMVGGGLMAPADQGGDLARAEATFLQGLEAARQEALGPPRPAWAPAWGGPENLMSLAFLNAFRPRPRPEVARAYAEGALALAPEWRYVRDVLLPRIAQLEAASLDAGVP